MSQWLVLALSTSYPQLGLYLRDITHIYIQSTTLLNWQFYIWPYPKFELQNGSIMKVIKLLYNVSEKNTY